MALLVREDHGAVARLVLNSPNNLNALSDAMLADLTAAFAALEQDRTIRVVILAGTGRAFCAGHDLKEMTAARAAPDVGAAAFDDLFDRCARVMQAIFVPSLAVAFATAPVAGQNFGARRFDRVRGTLRASLSFLSGLMLALTLVCQWRPESLVAGFTDDPEVIAVGADYLRIISINFLAAGVNFTNSSMFQAVGNTMPALIASGVRLASFSLPVLWLTSLESFTIRQIWWISVVSSTLQAIVSWLLLRRELARRLVPPADETKEVSPG